jgi:hypothetical protein
MQFTSRCSNTEFDVIMQLILSTDSFMNAAGAMFLPYTQTVKESLGNLMAKETLCDSS